MKETKPKLELVVNNSVLQIGDEVTLMGNLVGPKAFNINKFISFRPDNGDLDAEWRTVNFDEYGKDDDVRVDILKRATAHTWKVVEDHGDYSRIEICFERFQIQMNITNSFLKKIKKTNPLIF